MALAVGNKIMIKSREVNGDDVASGLYFSYFGGLRGVVDHIYDDESVCVDVDLNSLQKEARDRHLEMQEAENKRWLDGISAELKRKLTPEQKKLTISYKILVSKKDLEVI